jgi:hypothetical protein
LPYNILGITLPFAQKLSTRRRKLLVNKEKEFNNMFKENKNNGEHRNGRKSQFKNSSTNGEKLNEYLDSKD